MADLGDRVIDLLKPVVTSGLRIVAQEVNTMADRHVPVWTGALRRSMDVHEKNWFTYYATTGGEGENPITNTPLKKYIYTQYYNDLRHRVTVNGFADLTATYRGEGQEAGEGGLAKYQRAYRQAKADGTIIKTGPAAWYKKIAKDSGSVARLQEIFAGVFR